MVDVAFERTKGELVNAGQMDVYEDLNLLDGGIVTQLTNKSTGVTLDTTTGQITMNLADLLAAAEVTFTLTNNKIGAQSVIIVHHGSVGTNGAYLTQCTLVAAGSCSITVSNLSAGTLGEAIVLHFAVIGGSAT